MRNQSNVHWIRKAGTNGWCGSKSHQQSRHSSLPGTNVPEWRGCRDIGDNGEERRTGWRNAPTEDSCCIPWPECAQSKDELLSYHYGDNAGKSGGRHRRQPTSPL